MLVHNFPLENVAINCRANKTRRFPTVPTTHIAQWALHKIPKPQRDRGPIKVYKTKATDNQKKKSKKLKKRTSQTLTIKGENNLASRRKREWNLKPLARFAVDAL